MGGALRSLMIVTLAVLLTACSQPATPSPPSSPASPSVPASPAPLPGNPAAPSDPAAPGVPPGLTLTKVAGGLTKPLLITHAGDGSRRLFLLEQPGRIRILQAGRLLEEPFLDLTGLVLDKGSEQGLLGLAFAPDYDTSGLFYIHYTGRSGQTVLARYRAHATNANRADAASAAVLLTVAQPYANHNGGQIQFGPDGYLYMALGDGGSGGDPHNNAQDLTSLLGKLLRLDVRAKNGYTIPPDNPFVGSGGQDEIWAYGLRNPWRFSFDRETGDLYIADVGQQDVEEVNLQPAGSPGGENYGWRVFEGSSRYSSGNVPDAVFPVIEYRHTEGRCSITGGYVYRGRAIAGLQGRYVYGDFCSGQIWAASRQETGWSSTELMQTDLRISSFGVDEEGEHYVADHRGDIYRIESAGTAQ